MILIDFMAFIDGFLYVRFKNNFMLLGNCQKKCVSNIRITGWGKIKWYSNWRK